MSNNKTPRFPDSYLGKKSEEYDSSIWMERNQKKTTLICIQYLYDKNLDNIGKRDIIKSNDIAVLDLGCGTGFSSEMLAIQGFNVVGIEILTDMVAHLKHKLKSKFLEIRKKLNFILADINHLPIRAFSINHIFSISAYNFITHGVNTLKDKMRIVNNSTKSLYRILKPNGRVIIEFYPQDEKELNLFVSTFKNNNFNGYYLKDNPNQKAGQTFLLLKKGE